ncbi:MAG: hypothetical protein WAV21_01220 [Minisyncoccia bacterium]
MTIAEQVALWFRERRFQAYAYEEKDVKKITVTAWIRGPRGFLWFRRPKEVEYYIAAVWLSYQSLGATEEHWVIEIYGESNFSQFVEYAKQFEENFGVKIRLHLAEKEASRLFDFPPR